MKDLWLHVESLAEGDLDILKRVQRSPERYAFYVDVGDLPPQEALSYIQKVRDQYRRKKFTP